MSGNLRITDIGNGLQSEAIATDLHLRYNPVDKSVRVEFSYADYVTRDGEVIGNFMGENRRMLSFDFSELATRRFGAGQVDPVSQLRLDNVTSAGVMAILLGATDILFNEKAQPLPPILPIPESTEVLE